MRLFTTSMNGFRIKFQTKGAPLETAGLSFNQPNRFYFFSCTPEGFLQSVF